MGSRLAGLLSIIATIWLLGGCHLIFPFGVVAADAAPADAAGKDLGLDVQTLDLVDDATAPDGQPTPDTQAPVADSVLDATTAPDAAVVLDATTAPDAAVALDLSAALDLAALDAAAASETGTSCSSSGNLALQATASSSGGGLSKYGPDKMNDNVFEPSCFYHWVQASKVPSGKWIQLEWTTPQTVNTVSIDTVVYAGTKCVVGTGRNLAGGTLQYWDGGKWVDLGQIAGKTDDWSYSFTTVKTTRLRLYDLVSGQLASPAIFEWQALCK